MSISFHAPFYTHAYTHSYTYAYIHIQSGYGVAIISRLLKITGLFCRIQSLLQGSFAKETYNFRGSTNRSHPMENSEHSVSLPPHTRVQTHTYIYTHTHILTHTHTHVHISQTECVNSYLIAHNVNESCHELDVNKNHVTNWM